MTNRLKAHLAVLAANLFYGINFSVMKFVTIKLMSPLALNVLRIAGSTLLFWLFVMFSRQSLFIEKRHRWRLIVCTLTGVIINQVLFTRGLSLTTPIHGALLMLVCPIAVVFIAAVLIGERVSLKKIIGLGLGVSGAVLLILLRENKAESSDILTGDLLIMVNALSYAFYLVLVQPLMKHYNGMVLLMWMFTLANFIMIPAGWRDCIMIQWQNIPPEGWVAILFVVVAVTFLAYLLNIYSIRHLGPTVTGAHIYTQPFFAGIISVLYAGDTEHLGIKASAAVLIMTGVYLVSQKRKTVSE
jgi:drug/metabolite transporter (DMT)-like permease